MSKESNIIEKEPFVILPLFTKGAKFLYNSMENMPRENTSDAETNRECCGCLLCITCWPIYLVVDFISCPIRGCIHIKNK